MFFCRDMAQNQLWMTGKEPLPEVLIAAGSDYSDQDYLDDDPDFLKEEAGEEINQDCRPSLLLEQGHVSFQ